MAKVPNGVETSRKISIAWVGCTNVTDDRQTDRQTDGRWHIANKTINAKCTNEGRIVSDSCYTWHHQLAIQSFCNGPETAPRMKCRCKMETRADIMPRLKILTRNSSEDSERELTLLRHCTRTTNYNRLVHKFRQRLPRLCVGTQSEITQYNGHYAVQGHRFWYQSKAPIRLPISD